MIKKRKVLIIVSVCALLLSCVVGGIYAYFSNAENITNPFNVGDNNITIVEEFTPPTDQTGDIPKTIQVKNMGSMPCYVRISANFSDSDNANLCTVDWNLVDWVYNELDNYYYYKYPIAVNEMTKPLCTKVTVDDSLAAPSDFDIIVYAESIQEGDNPDYKSAWADFNVIL